MPALIDLTGQQFGELKVLERDQASIGAAKPRWLCECLNCGKIVSMRADLLRAGRRKSCGCLNKALTTQPIQIGQTYGKYKVISQLASDKKHTYYNCQCSCGNPNLLRIRGDSLRAHHHLKGCGKCEAYLAINQLFGYLKVLDYAGLDSHDNVLVKAKCTICESVKTYQISHLKTGKISSCGCIRSIGERNISKLLSEACIPFTTEYIFQDLKGKSGIHLRFDFAIFDDDIKTPIRLIEFDGPQHFVPVTHFGGEAALTRTQENDKIKNEYAFKHNIPLVRIPYTLKTSVTLMDLLSDKYLVKEK